MEPQGLHQSNLLNLLSSSPTIHFFIILQKCKTEIPPFRALRWGQLSQRDYLD